MNNLEKKITLLCGDPKTGVRRSVKFVRSCLSHQWVVVVDERMMYMDHDMETAVDQALADLKN